MSNIRWSDSMEIVKPQLFCDVKGLMLNSAKLYADRAAFVIKHGKGDYETKTYTDFLNDVNRFGQALFNLGLSGKRIAVIGRNCYEWAVAHIANLLGGIVSVPLDKELQFAELEESLKRSGAEAVVFDVKYKDKINAVIDGGNTALKHAVCMAECEGLNVRSMIDGTDDFSQFAAYTPDPDAMSILLFTSGTTAKSKAVMLCQRGIAQNIYDMQCVERFYPTDVNIAFLPLHHIFGSTGITVMLSCGVKTVFTDGLRYIKQNLKEYGVSVFVGVPVLIDSMYKNIEREIKKQGKEKLFNFAGRLSNFLMAMKIDIRRKLHKQVIDALGGKMRLIISGGAPLDAKTSKRFNEMGILLVQGYGLTETSPVIAAENPQEMRTGSVGKPMGSLSVKIDNPDSDGMGEICVKGSSVMLGYYENADATNAVLKDGWFHTGDLGHIDNDGFLFITGRHKDMIVMKNGKKVFPEEIETLINRIDGVKESFVYGKGEDGLSCDKILCKVVYDPAYFDGEKEDIHTSLWNSIKEINKTLPMYKYIKGLTITETPLIKTSTNKIKRNEELKTL